MVDSLHYLEWRSPLPLEKSTHTTWMKTCGGLVFKTKCKDLADEIMYLGAWANICYPLVE
jgi:hypothetical protein